MEREHGNAHLRDVFDAFCDGVVDIEELHVEEDFFLRRDKAFCEAETARENELIPDLVEGNSIAQLFDRLLRLSNSRHVEAHDQLIAQICRRHESLRGDFYSLRTTGPVTKET